MTVTRARREVVLDTTREQRIGFGEAVLAGSKTVEQVVEVLDQADDKGLTLLLTRLERHQVAAPRSALTEGPVLMAKAHRRDPRAQKIRAKRQHEVGVF